MKRTIIKIDEDLCNGCGACIKGCHEGALQLIDNKARMISDLFCDGLGACIGECPVGAIELEEREAEPYDERAVMERIAVKGEKTIMAHLKHLKDHNEMEFLAQGVAYAKEHNLQIDLSELEAKENPKMACGCPGSMARSFAAPSVVSHAPNFASTHADMPSELTHWPVQLHLLNPMAGYFVGADILLAADCTAFAFPDFHSRFLKGKKLAIACPKLDTNKESYVAKLAQMIDGAKINTLTVVVMEVPCCGGLMVLARQAAAQATRKIPLKQIVVGVQGDILNEEWI